ncbi:Serine/threonine protein kinase [Candidatus Sulfopaludibacter sp. SbA6]|nr:Serine/threonine protein kinase [Candidatus Sulfopaludibacter sp. SbA6]
MPLAAGSRFGPYEILGLIGSGGMGEVYRARDPRLSRDVAIKMLHGDSGHRIEGRRLESEARAASRLNHPNIVTVYDIGEEQGVPYIVSELVAGETLAALMRPGGIAIRKLLDIAVQIADGLACAHQAGVTHRDLKPVNIMITPGGQVKILDFGLAKTSAPVEQSDVTQTLATSPGMIVGTVPYMSPEQARGEPVDFRSDQFSLGSILYEMAAGRRPFPGRDTVETLSAIVKSEPALIAASNPQVPSALRWTIQRCLAKEPASRFASTTDLHRQLQDLKDHLPEVLSGETAAPAVAAHHPKRRIVLAASALAALSAGAGFLGSRLLSRSEPAASYRFQPFATEAADETQPAWSPDGLTLAYVGTVNSVPQVFTRAVASGAPVEITRAASACSRPFWSRDAVRLYYLSGGSLWSVGATGGAPQLVAKDAGGAGISPDGRTLALFHWDGQRNALWTGTASGENLAVYKQPPFPASFRFAHGLQFAPDGRKLIVGLIQQIGLAAPLELWIVPFPGGTARRIPHTPTSITVHDCLAWMADSRHVVIGAQIPVGSAIHLYSLDTETGEVVLLTGSTGEELDPSVSPDGKTIAFAQGSTDLDLMEGSLDRPQISVLLATSRKESAPSWTPSGHQYSYISDAGGMPEVWLRSVVEGWARPVVTANKEGFLAPNAPRTSPDGQRIAYTRYGARHKIWISSTSGGPEVPLDEQTTDQHACAWSPDGNWIAYTRYAAGKWEIAKAPSGGAGQPVSSRMGAGPLRISIGRPRASGLLTAVTAASSVSYRRKAEKTGWRAPSRLPASDFPRTVPSFS